MLCVCEALNWPGKLCVWDAQTLVIGFVVYTLAVVLFALFYFAGGDDCANHEMNFRNAVYIRQVYPVIPG